MGGGGGPQHPTSARLANHRKNVAGPASTHTLSSISTRMKEVSTVHQPQVTRWEHRKKENISALEKLCGLRHLSVVSSPPPRHDLNCPILQKTWIWYTLRQQGCRQHCFPPKNTFLINRFYLPQPSSLMFTQPPLRTF